MNLLDEDEPESNDPQYQAEFEKLFKEIGVVLRNHMAGKGLSRALVYQVLNVMAAHTAVVLAACEDHEADRFFHGCLNGTLQTAREEHDESGWIANRHHSG